jgi:hypothetical protein
MNRQMPSKGRDPRKHNLSVAMAKELVNDCKEALARPNLPGNLRTIVKHYKNDYSTAKNRKTFSGFVLAG